MQSSLSPLIRLATFVIGFSLSSLFAVNIASADPFKNYSIYGGEVDREPNRKKRKSCSKHYYCGPTTTIKLSMHGSGEADTLPDEVLGTGGYAIGEGGTFEQMLRMGESYGKDGGISIMVDRLRKTREADDGQKVIIVMPMIDYGFSGTFNNIKINATKSGKSLNSSKKNEYGEHISFTGSVTIEKYAPNVLKGSYSGALYRYEHDRDHRGPAWEPTPVHLVATGSLNGEFNILRPWHGDNRINKNIDNQSSIVDPMKEDIKRLVKTYGIDIDVDKEFEKVDANAKKNSRGKSTSYAPAYGGCDCSCNYTQSASANCKAVCSDVFEVCRGDRYQPPVRKTFNENADLQTNLDDLATELEEIAPKIKEAVPELQELAPKLQELAPALRELAPEIEDMGEKLTLEPGKKIMNLDQETVNLDQETVNRLESNEVIAPSNLRDKFIILAEQKFSGQALAPFRENMIKEFDSLPDEKSKMVMYISLGGKE